MVYLVLLFIGILGGLASGFFGVGGGLIFVPLLILLRKFDPHLAIGTSLAVIVPTAAIAAFRNFRSGLIDWRAAVVLTVFAMIGSWIAAGISIQMDIAILKRFFAVFLVLVALKMFFSK